jgi:hypothetical protein
MRHIPCLVLIVLASLALNACGATASPAPYVETRVSGSLSATLRILPYPPVPMEETALELELRDDSGQALSGAAVHLDLTMPGMEMPANHPEVAEGGDGLYRAQAIFTMAGEWEIRVEVYHAGESVEFTFPASTK